MYLHKGSKLIHKWKIAASATCLLALVVLAAACGSTQNTYTPPTTTLTTTTPSIPLVTYKNAAHGFSVAHLEEWTANETYLGKSYTVSFSYIEGQVTTEVSIDYYSGEAVLSKFVSKTMGYMSALPLYELKSQSDITISGGVPGQDIVFEAQYLGKLVEFRYVFLVRGKQGFMVGARGEPVHFDHQKSLIDATVKSFELLPTYTYEPTASPGGIYTNNQYGFSVTYTDGWVQSPPDQHGGVVEFTYDGLMPIVTVGVSNETPGTTLETFVTQAKAVLPTIWGDFKLISEGSITLDDGTPAYKMVVSGTIQGSEVKCKYVAAIKGTQVFEIAGFDVPSQFDGNESIMDEVILSFHLN
jgi:hypothetical protein